MKSREEENMTTRTRRIAILGAGPIGIEAALCAREQGYEVAVFERGRLAEHCGDTCGGIRLNMTGSQSVLRTPRMTSK